MNAFIMIVSMAIYGYKCIYRLTDIYVTSYLVECLYNVNTYKPNYVYNC